MQPPNKRKSSNRIGKNLLFLIYGKIITMMKAIVAMIAPVIPINERIVTMMPAMSTPPVIANNAEYHDIENINASADPVHAPVIGRGIATNSISPKSPYLFTR